MNCFRQYDYFKYTEKQYKEIWETAHFVFDTSALLNLYRYEANTQKDFLGVLKLLEEKIWIPHHVALEFNKNRLKVIAEQISLFNNTKKVIDEIEKKFNADIQKLSLKKIHKIDSLSISNKISTVLTQINADLKKQIDSEIKLRGEDPIENELQNLFNGKVGNQPSKQEDIDTLEKEAEKRFKLKMSPGFEDDNKDDVCLNNGILYKKKYSDYIIWRQILDFAPTIASKNIIFVTADSKKGDWFLEISANGNHLYQPKPELLDEAYNIGKLDNFLMYDTESFLKFAKEYLNYDISNSSIKEASDIQQFQIISNFYTSDNTNISNKLNLLKL